MAVTHTHSHAHTYALQRSIAVGVNWPYAECWAGGFNRTEELELHRFRSLLLSFMLWMNQIRHQLVGGLSLYRAASIPMAGLIVFFSGVFRSVDPEVVAGDLQHIQRHTLHGLASLNKFKSVSSGLQAISRFPESFLGNALFDPPREASTCQSCVHSIPGLDSIRPAGPNLDNKNPAEARHGSVGFEVLDVLLSMGVGSICESSSWWLWFDRKPKATCRK